MALHDFTAWPRGPLHLGIGVFDGVHVGHRTLVGLLASRAHRAGAAALAVTFDPMPVEVFAPGAPPSRLSDIPERVALLRDAGADDVVVLGFTRDMASWPPDEFMARVAGAGDVREIVVGEDFRFGHDRAGDVVRLRALGEGLGFAVHVAPPVLRDGRVVSSTRIRNALLAGDVGEAAALLGRPYAVTGSVERGDPRGRELGYPTVSLAVPARRLLPRDGIYAVWATVNGRRVAAAASLGVRTTGERRLELYLLDHPGGAYGEHVRAELVMWLRDELRFESAETLAEQIARDVERTRAALR